MTNPRGRGRARHWVRLLAGLVLLGMAFYAVWQQPQRAAVNSPPPGITVLPTAEGPSESDQRAQGVGRPTKGAAAPGDSPDAPHATIVPDQTIYDLDGKVAFQGDVDVTATLARIAAGQRLNFRNDGATFENRERRLPRKPSGYYQEYVHPTPGLAGPGPQRIVTGDSGETYYTPDHYRTFRRLDGP